MRNSCFGLLYFLQIFCPRFICDHGSTPALRSFSRYFQREGTGVYKCIQKYAIRLAGALSNSVAVLMI